ncbi:MAG: decaprenyl-phosphate phosphoribosyltransferase [Syntrophomonas sp.]|nr:decaprenyl-phosphate phosphoribosyltransferase [Syntrophomonas sp.]
MAYLKLLRINQWIKNFFVFIPLIFSLNLFNLPILEKSLEGFICFCLMSSSVYIFNDIKDIEQDKVHPRKKFRPIAAGQISPRIASMIMVILIILSLGLAIHFTPNAFTIVLVLYLLNNILYTIWVKHIVILDVMSLSLGFFLRVYSGAVVIRVEASDWLLIFTALLTLFLGFGKRRSELELIKDAVDHRTVLQYYSIKYIDQMIGIVTAGLILAYMLYTLSPETVEHFGTKGLVLTVPFVLYGVFRYLYLIYVKSEGEDPTKLSYQDKPILITVVIWLIAVIAIIYCGVLT